MSGSPGGVEILRQQRPEWSPWLAVVAEVLGETDAGPWDRIVPQPHTGGSVPLLSGASIQVDGAAAGRLLKRLTSIAARGGTAKMATLGGVTAGDLDIAALFAASIRQDADGIAAAARGCGADPDAFQAVAALLAIPFLHACNRQWTSSIGSEWLEGYCPICASWPAFVEVRGIERSRHFRCGRCGGAWYAELLRCAYCGTRDHDELATLVPETGSTTSVLDACRRCRGYVKALTRLQGCPPGRVLVEDLQTVDLDVAALEQGYARPAGAARSLEVTVHRAPGARGLFAWNS